MLLKGIFHLNWRNSGRIRIVKLQFMKREIKTGNSIPTFEEEAL